MPCVHAHGYSPKFCHYYNNSTFCPYEKFGCKFSYSDAEICKFDKACKRELCPFKHNAMITNSSYSNSNSSESNVQTPNINKNINSQSERYCEKEKEMWNVIELRKFHQEAL